MKKILLPTGIALFVFLVPYIVKGLASFEVSPQVVFGTFLLIFGIFVLAVILYALLQQALEDLRYLAIFSTLVALTIAYWFGPVAGAFLGFMVASLLMHFREKMQ